MTIYRVVKHASGRKPHGLFTRDAKPSDCYKFNIKKIRLPAYVQIIITKEIRELVHDARTAASAAFKELRRLDDHLALRFHHLCPADPISRFAGHCGSVDAVFNWRKQGNPGYANPLNKMPASLVNFHANEAAFNEYLAEHQKLREAWVAGAYSTWRVKARVFVDKVFHSGLSTVEKRGVLMWWDGFMDEMRVWENRFDKMRLPTFEDVVDELSNKIENNVDLSNGGYIFF